jgi:hypothetical protein
MRVIKEKNLEIIAQKKMVKTAQIRVQPEKKNRNNCQIFRFFIENLK